MDISQHSRHRLATTLLLGFVLLLTTAQVSLAQNPFLTQQGERQISAIHIFGNRVTKEYVILRELDIKVGDVYDDEALNEGWARLEQLDFIAYVDIQVKRLEPDLVFLEILIEEDHRFVWQPGLEYSRRFNWQLTGDFAFNNFRGRDEKLWLHAGVIRIWDFRGGWENPWILGKAKLGVGVDGMWDQYGFVFEPYTFTDQRVGARLWRDFASYFKLSTSYYYRDNVVTNSLSSTTPDGHYIEPFTDVKLEFDSRNLRYYPSNGLYCFASYNWHGLGQDDPYQIWRLWLSGFKSVPYLGILAGRAQYKGADGDIPDWGRSYYGGPETIRGVKFGTVRGDEAFLGTIEIRKPIFLVPLRRGRAVGFGVHGFADWGTTWDVDFTIDDAVMRSTYGLGLHFNLNTHNYRFEWAWGDDDNGFVFEDSFNF